MNRNRQVLVGTGKPLRQRIPFRFLALLILPSLALADSTPVVSSAPPVYPIADPYRATVIGTPPELVAQVPAPRDVPTDVDSMVRFPERDLSPIFWNGTKLHYSLSKQKEEAPLVFVIAGTGASWQSEKVRFLKRALYGAGFHVLALSSPTNPRFMTAGSEYSLPGLPAEDARDLMAVMALASEQLGDLPIRGHALVGYSLGATQSAFIAAAAASDERWDFERVYLINPSVRLYTSASNLDALYAKALPEGPVSINTLVEQALSEASHYVQKKQRGPLDADFIMAAIASRATDLELEAAIGASFRLSSANMSFVSDLMRRTGKIIEPGKKIGIGTSLTPYFDRSLGWSFIRYLDELLLPFWEQKTSRDRQTLIDEASLHAIADFLKSTDTVAVTTNADDPILGPGDIEFLTSTFGSRATIHPHGGHCGNLEFAPVVAGMIEFLSEPWPRHPEAE